MYSQYAMALPTPATLQVDDLSVVFSRDGRRQRVLNGLSFSLAQGEIGCLLGASGCGKSTALRVIAGFVRPERGAVAIGGRSMLGANLWVPPEARGTGVVFQDYALFPHLDIESNIGFGLKGRTASERAARVTEMLRLVGLDGMNQRFPHELSGGQQQRVALARALAPAPALLLLDEPFSSLDPELRERLALELREILKAAAITTLLVTHDQYEAFAMADSVGVMADGRIAQWDTPYRLYHQPVSREVADFVGHGAFLPGRVREADGNAQIEIELGTLPILARTDQAIASAMAAPTGEVTVLLRPDDVVHDDASPVQAQVVRKAFRGAQFLYTLKLPSGATLLALVPSHHDHPVGEQIGIRFAADHIVTFESRNDTP
ncbi:MAG: ABC transporter ATP-binding protein [Betaproteobacteria bacterium]|nr:ABC transporter ATP-binding protein [Betaproteobacteria bacterium]